MKIRPGSVIYRAVDQYLGLAGPLHVECVPDPHRPGTFAVRATCGRRTQDFLLENVELQKVTEDDLCECQFTQWPPATAIPVGRYVRVTDLARVDAIGRIVRHTAVGAVVEVPNWTADGMPMEFHARWEHLEQSTRVAAQQAADRRGGY